jgi:hypothetical protein
MVECAGTEKVIIPTNSLTEEMLTSERIYTYMLYFCTTPTREP